jgi:hypothetical protein
MHLASTCLIVNVQDEVWLVDSRASFHLTPHKDCFKDREKVHEGKVLLGDNFSGKTIGKDNVRIKYRDGRVKWIPNERHMSGLTCNILLIS